MESLGLKLQNVELQNLAVDLVTFYHQVIKGEVNPIDSQSNKKILRQLRERYAKKLRRDDSSTVSFESPDVRCAYVFRFCPSFTGALASHFLLFLKGNPELAYKLLMQDTVTVCCLGGGPGTELVAICKVLENVLKQCRSERTRPLLVDAAVVDSERGWAAMAGNVTRSLPKLVDSSLVRIGDFRFLGFDLTESLPGEVTDVLVKSDLVTMVKFLSAIHGPKDTDVRARTLQEVCGSMPFGSTLLFMDSSGWKCAEGVAEVVRSSHQMTLIYGPLKKTYRMSKTSKKACQSLFSGMYGRKDELCTMRSSNTAIAWCKKDD